MITGFLLAYTTFTAPLLVWGAWRAWRKTHPAKSKHRSELEAFLEATFGKHGIEATVHEMPSTPEEAIMAQARLILNAIAESDRNAIAWLTSLRDKADAGKRDMDAVMLAVQAMTKAMLEMPTRAQEKKLPPGNAENFVHNLEYVRDVYATTPTQKNALKAIISSIRTNHGTK